jgi:hypothetical protein
MTFVLDIDKPATLLLRIRAETLRINLERAHEKLKELPNLRPDLYAVQDVLATIRMKLEEGIRVLAAAKTGPRQLDRDGIKKQGELLDEMDFATEIATCKLTEIENKSFLVQVRKTGERVWNSLDLRAVKIKKEFEGVDLAAPSAWQEYSRFEAEANLKVFNESVELLGGIALRDARLGAEVCELADAMIVSTFRTLPSVLAIPGGIATMMMDLEPIIRLRFPEWTLWALPLTAHEVWNAVAGKVVMERITIGMAADKLKMLRHPKIQLCLADAFGTYMIGPAYAFAAIILLLDPLQPRDEARVHAMLEMLTAMAPAKIDDYAAVADGLLTAWEAAKSQAKTAAAATGLRFEPLQPPDEVQVNAILEMLAAVAPTCVDRHEAVAAAAVRTAWEAATRQAKAAAAATGGAAVAPPTSSPTASPPELAKASQTPGIENAREAARLLGRTLSDVLKVSGFTLDNWKQKSQCCEALFAQLSNDAITRLDLSNLDIRHALNAAWCVRIHPQRPLNQEKAPVDLTGAAMQLARAIKDKAAKPVPRSNP